MQDHKKIQESLQDANQTQDHSKAQQPRRKKSSHKDKVPPLPISHTESPFQQHARHHNTDNTSPSRSRAVTFSRHEQKDAVDSLDNKIRPQKSDPINITQLEHTIHRPRMHQKEPHYHTEQQPEFKSPRNRTNSQSPSRKIAKFITSDHKTHSQHPTSLEHSPRNSPKSKDSPTYTIKPYDKIIFEAIKMFQIEIDDLYYIANILIQTLKGANDALLDNVNIRKRRPASNFHTPIQFTDKQISSILSSITNFAPRKPSKKYDYFIAHKLDILIPYITNKFRKSLMNGMLSHIATCDSLALHFDNEELFLHHYFSNSSTVVDSLSSLCNMILAPSPLVLNTHIISKYKYFDVAMLYEDFERITTEKIADLIQNNNLSHIKKFQHYISQALFEEHKYMFCCTDNESLHLLRFLHILNCAVSERFTINYREIKYAIAKLKHELLLSETILIKQIINDISHSFISMTGSIDNQLDLDISSPHMTDNASYNLISMLKDDLFSKQIALKSSKKQYCESYNLQDYEHLDFAERPAIHLPLRHAERYSLHYSSNQTSSLSGK